MVQGPENGKRVPTTGETSKMLADVLARGRERKREILRMPMSERFVHAANAIYEDFCRLYKYEPSEQQKRIELFNIFESASTAGRRTTELQLAQMEEDRKETVDDKDLETMADRAHDSLFAIFLQFRKDKSFATIDGSGLKESVDRAVNSYIFPPHL